MKDKLKQVSEIIADANDKFYTLNSTHDTVIGIMDKTLRQQGMKADAITIECVPLDKKIVFLIHDEKPLHVDIALGNKEGDITSSFQLAINALTIENITEILLEYFN